ncbi:MAG: hypothetical protein JNK55_19765 [Rubrivivax sp.]|nr:hypothetical protein [Rubrivivax sp.]
MTRKLVSRSLGAVALSLLGSAASAQDIRVETRIDAPARLAQAELERRIVIDDGADITMFGPGGAAAERVVKGAPYCAEAVHETVQWLADGSGGAPNRIARQQMSRLCRDGEGRTRQETERGGRKVVYLRDPVSRENWVLDPERRTARRQGEWRVGGMEGLIDSQAFREYADKLREYARGMAERARGVAPIPPAPPAPPVPPAAPVAPGAAPADARAPTPVVISHTDGVTREVRVMRLRDEAEAAAAEWAAPPAAVQLRALSGAPRGPGSTTPLPARDLEGLRVNGERTTWVIEAGRIGNERPIQIVREVWTSPELMLTVSSRDADPRSGEVNYRLRNIQRGEPDAALMRVPADYTRPAARPAPKAPGAIG